MLHKISTINYIIFYQPFLWNFFADIIAKGPAEKQIYEVLGSRARHVDGKHLDAESFRRKGCS